MALCMVQALGLGRPTNAKVILSRTLNRHLWLIASLGNFDEKKYFYSRAFSTVVGMLAKFE